ncbi:zinc-binding dehydrogenase [Paenibacillus oceani]|uniref:Alcohol dehydrogenase catalytic domain-containing protein n=1 Tax=Paenibacillus oceani TaxID=2772510 RepID=A0A927H343_9BACL|nr:alcohol dehydrogenase catalytic domain-containing protein [Paenibacillus oceani]MBD2866911.1 alcohol dehydrogenase catalytic domain-containing protein [Paenibacillus oceani]
MKEQTTTTIVPSRAYRLLQPKLIREVVLEHTVPDGYVVVEPTLASICHADLRYYTGQRRPEALARKLPMSLLHEGIGKVVVSRDAGCKEGQNVVIVPNMPGYMLDGAKREDCCPACRGAAGDNYCYRGRFLGSGIDGIAQRRIVVPAGCAIPVPEEVPDEIAVLTELCSVSYQAITRVKERWGNMSAAVFGDGPVGYLTAAMLHHAAGLDQDRLLAFGAIEEKLEQFQFARRELVQQFDFGAAEPVDVAVECTGGRFSESAVNQAIDLLRPGGVLILMGVTEERVPINTRDILEKGITVIGSSRSMSRDFQAVMELMRRPSCQETLRRLLPERTKPVRKVEDYIEAMEEAAAHRDWKKTVLEFHW